jgi:hypothetical protein
LFVAVVVAWWCRVHLDLVLTLLRIPGQAVDWKWRQYPAEFLEYVLGEDFLKVV